ncbi:MAG: bifunctional phosphoribosylaminoimidazolecarboxamide formyltransferase/IMP cyclohydrolase, partial [Elusimicrobia bacterium]|nr:bifunctional phosphoribosylaminoimidazolecarboxamide formyltransferase/IMP cyclohydrolase [Elusimicrobiota bacterium]
FKECAVVIFKHVTPCGAAVGKNVLEAFESAWKCDPLSAFGGVIAFNRKLTADVAKIIAGYFVEVISAPDYEEEALKILSQKKNLRLLRRQFAPSDKFTIRSVGEDVLVAEPDSIVLGDVWKIASKRAPSKEESAALRFGWIVCKHVRSNAIVLSDETSSVGIGAGQMSRVDSVHIAGEKLGVFLKTNPKPKTLVMASDAFFPFRDAVDEAAKLGVTAIIQPGGSLRDEDSITAVNERNIAMVFTAIRHFKH